MKGERGVYGKQPLTTKLDVLIGQGGVWVWVCVLERESERIFRKTAAWLLRAGGH